MNSKIGVITVTYNSANVLSDFLSSIKTQTHNNFVLYIIDNNSQDTTSDIIKQFDDSRINYVQNSENLGVAAGNNIGIRLAMEENCDFILFLNNDTKFEENTFEKLIIGINEHGAELVAPIIYYYDKKDYIWSAGGDFDKIFKFEIYHIGFKEKDIDQYDNNRLITYAPTCCLLIKTETLREIGLFDENYFCYEDDVDFCYRATILNNKIMMCLSSFKFYHKVGALTNNKDSFLSEFAIKYRTENFVYRCKKYFSFNKMILLLLFFFRENLKIILNKRYNRSLNTFFLFNKSYFAGIKK